MVDDGDDEDDVVGNVVVQFSNKEGDTVGDAMDVPTSAGSDELATLIRSLLDQEDDEDGHSTNKAHIPYAFFAKIERTVRSKHPSTGEELVTTHTEDVDITDYSSLKAFLRKYRNDVSTEQTLQLTYQPMALFKVRPVTRCTDTLPGHTDAILHVSYSPDGKH